uniref:Uncharacterized protein n=1 Tax=Arundo donax TaxID=35708 RepID=A0A0A9AX38_ARUDO
MLMFRLGNGEIWSHICLDAVTLMCR